MGMERSAPVEEALKIVPDPLSVGGDYSILITVSEMFSSERPLRRRDSPISVPEDFSENLTSQELCAEHNLDRTVGLGWKFTKV